MEPGECASADRVDPRFDVFELLRRLLREGERVDRVVHLRQREMELAEPLGGRQHTRVAGGAVEALAVGEGAARELHGLAIREEGNRVLGSEQEVIRRALVLARGLEQIGEPSGDVAGAIAVRLDQSLGHRRAHLEALARPQRAVDGVLIEDVHEAVALAQFSVRKLGLLEHAHESMHAPEAVEPLLDVADVGAERGGDRHRVEVVPCTDAQARSRRSAASMRSTLCSIMPRTDSGSSPSIAGTERANRNPSS